ncbi:hypothetical protein HanRHA438_Chr17g0792561 [Helianthus annuus]|nr:hypothetical protein HanRHA438_Chr17g0792561 [Helianthus annuus]
MTSPVEASVSKRLISWLNIDFKYAILIFAACLSPVLYTNRLGAAWC